jgi:hypothetical protein
MKLWLFPTIDIGIGGQRLVPAEENQQKTAAGFTAVPKEDFQSCFQQWQDHCSKYVCTDIISG